MKIKVVQAYALINGALQRYDVSLSIIDKLYKIDHNKYTELGVGIIDNVEGRKDYNNTKMIFLREKTVKKKRNW